MNDGYGKLVSRFPHLQSTTVPPMIFPPLTLVFCHAECYLHALTTTMLLLSRSSIIQHARPSIALHPPLIKTFPVHMSHHLIYTLRMMWWASYPTTRILPTPRFTTRIPLLSPV